MISCADAVQRLWSYLEDELAATDRQAVDDHLAFCRRCCGEAEFAAELRHLLASAGEVSPPLPDDVESRLLAVLDTFETFDDAETADSADQPGGNEEVQRDS